MMRKVVTAILFFLMSATVYADGNYGCVMNVSAGFNWVNGLWKLTNFNKVNILISVQGNGSKMKYKEANDSFESEYACSVESFFHKSTFLRCGDNFGGTVLFDEVTLKGGSSQLIGSITRENKYKDSLIVTEFTCQKF